MTWTFDPDDKLSAIALVADCITKNNARSLEAVSRIIAIAQAEKTQRETLLQQFADFVSQSIEQEGGDTPFYIARHFIIDDTTPISDLPISIRTMNALRGHYLGLRTAGDIRNTLDRELLRTPGLGKLSLAEIRVALSRTAGDA